MPQRLMLLAAVLLMAGSACQFIHANPARVVAQRFLQAMDPPSTMSVVEYLAPDAQVYLQGAPVPISRDRFAQYLSQMKTPQRTFRPASRIFLTPGGAGWLVSIGDDSEAQPVPPPPTDSAALLWMQIIVQDDTIARVWIHLTPEALARQKITPESYRDVAARAGTPVPNAWMSGTAAMLSAAEAYDRAADPPGFDTTIMLAPLSAMALAAAALAGVALALGWKHRRSRATRREVHGELWSRLRQTRAA